MSEVGLDDGGGGGEGREHLVLCKVYRTPRPAPVPAPPASTRGGSDSAVADAVGKIDPQQHPPRSSGRRPRSDLEEGEFVPSDDDSSVSDGDSRYVVQHRHANDARLEIERRASWERDSDGTISDVAQGQELAEAAPKQFVVHHPDAGVASLGQGPRFFTSPVCEEKFRSEKAARGHMRVHVPHGRQQGNMARTPMITGGWAVTSSLPRRSVSPESQDDSMAILGASSDNSTSQVVVHPPCSPQFLQGHQPAAPRVPGVLRLFGVNIVPGEPPASAAEEVSSIVLSSSQRTEPRNHGRPPANIVPRYPDMDRTS